MSVLTDRVNGHYTKVNGPPMHTFKDSNIAVKLHKLGPLTNSEILQAVQRELADEKPQPPITEVDYGKGTISQPHTGHPVYVKMLAAWNDKCNRIANDRLFKLACLVAVELTIGDVERKAITARKRYLKLAAKLDWQDDPELSQDENDQIFYITHIACASPDDLKEFYQAIATRSQPSEAAVQQHKESFPGDVQGSVDLDL
jgi:hypothetical protein